MTFGGVDIRLKILVSNFFPLSTCILPFSPEFGSVSFNFLSTTTLIIMINMIKPSFGIPFLLISLFASVALAEGDDVDITYQRCEGMRGIERAACRALQDLKVSGEEMPDLKSDGTCKMGQKLSETQRRFCALTASEHNKRTGRTINERVKMRAEQYRGRSPSKGAIAEKALKESREGFFLKVQEQLRGRQGRIDAQAARRHFILDRQERRRMNDELTGKELNKSYNQRAQLHEGRDVRRQRELKRAQRKYQEGQKKSGELTERAARRQSLEDRRHRVQIRSRNPQKVDNPRKRLNYEKIQVDQRVLDIYRSDTFQGGPLRYYRNAPRIRKEESK